ncbi:NAD(P)/FAD-dependent oxidoreductase [Jatrophihabitans sp. YIM 134969]
MCIVGGGYTGLWTALELKMRRPDLDVCVVEAQLCGSGASGTNAGLLMNLWPKFDSLQTIAGREGATWLAQQSSVAVEDIVDFCAEHQINADIQRAGWLWASTAPAQDDAWKSTTELVAELPNSPFQLLSSDEAQALGGPAVRGGVLDPTSATLQPALLARGLRRVAMDTFNVRIYENTPMRAMEHHGRRTTVMTPTGRVDAGAVVLAINAWMSAYPEVRRSMLTSASDNAITRPLPDDLLASTGSTGLGVADSTRMLNYWRTTADGRMMFGKGGVGLGYRQRGASSMFGQVPHEELIRREFNRLLPALANEAFVATWRAPVEYTLTSLPYFQKLANNDRVWFGTGYSGDGVGPSRMGGRILASLVLGEDDLWSRCALTAPPRGHLPPEPFRYLGGQLVKQAIMRKEKRENLNRRPGRMSDALSRLDPTTWV